MRSGTKHPSADVEISAAAMRPSVDDRAQTDLEHRLDYKFRRPELLELALTHRSYSYEGRLTPHEVAAAEKLAAAKGYIDARDQRNQPGTDNEQMEFLGDAVLGLAITEALFEEFPQCTEGELTRLRSNLVSRKRMAEMGTELGLGEHLRLGRSAEQNGSRRKPALLANTAEAVIAAVYLDALGPGNGGHARNGMGAIRRLVERYLLAPERAAMQAALAAHTNRGALRDHKTLLQERVQAEAAGKLRYIDVSQSGPPHQRLFAVEAQLEDAEGLHALASAEGPSKKEAQQRAAELALAGWVSRPKPQAPETPQIPSPLSKQPDPGPEPQPSLAAPLKVERRRTQRRAR